MNKEIKVTCNSCSNQFVIDQLRISPIKDDIEATYFTCTHCFKVYISFYTNSEIRRLQEQLRTIIEQLPTLKHTKLKRKKIQMEEVGQRLKDEMNELRKQMEEKINDEGDVM